MSDVKHVMRYMGFNIERNDTGYYWNNSDYFDTIQECKDDIDDYNESEREHYRDIDTPPDTPSLEAPWWRTEY